MTIDDILNSYDPVDLKYEQSFDNSIEPRESDSFYFSFIPSKEECERIFLKDEI